MAWSGQSYQERLSSGQAPLLYAVSLLVVFLCLAALYESWLLPFAVILIVPMCILAAMIGVTARDLDRNILVDIGLIVLVGLAAKNSILIVEFAEHLRQHGSSIVDAAVEAARIRLRPILMTSFAFILGVLPLAIATGAGSGVRQSVGTTVMGGMIASTFLSVVFITVLYVAIRTLAPGRKTRSHYAEETSETGAAHA